MRQSFPQRCDYVQYFEVNNWTGIRKKYYFLSSPLSFIMKLHSVSDVPFFFKLMYQNDDRTVSASQKTVGLLWLSRNLAVRARSTIRKHPEGHKYLHISYQKCNNLHKKQASKNPAGHIFCYYVLHYSMWLSQPPLKGDKFKYSGTDVRQKVPYTVPGQKRAEAGGATSNKKVDLFREFVLSTGGEVTLDQVVYELGTLWVHARGTT